MSSERSLPATSRAGACSGAENTAARAGWMTSVASAAWGPSRVLLIANLGAAGIGFALSFLLATQLGLKSFSTYALVSSVVLLVASIADVGVFASGARRLLSCGGDKSATAGALTIAWFGGAGVSTMLCVLLSLLPIFPEDAQRLLLLLAPLSGGATCIYFLEQLLKGSGRLRRLGICNLGVRAGVFSCSGALLLINIPNQLDALLAVSLTIPILVTLLILVGERASFRRGWAELIGPLWRVHRSFGLPLFWGRAANIAAYRSDVVLLAASGFALDVGPYTLALGMTSPVVMVAQAQATKLFRSSHGTTIDDRTLKRLAAAVTGMSVLVVVAGETAAALLLGREYEDLRWLLPAACAAALLQAAYQPFNAWLLANASGPRFRRCLVLAAGGTLAANVALIPLFGIAGAIVATATGNALYLSLMRRLYKQQVADAATRPTTGDGGSG